MNTERDADSIENADPSAYEPLDGDSVTVRQNEHGLYIADHEETGVSSQGPTADDALSNLAAAVDNYREVTGDDAGDDWL